MSWELEEMSIGDAKEKFGKNKWPAWLYIVLFFSMGGGEQQAGNSTGCSAIVLQFVNSISVAVFGIQSFVLHGIWLNSFVVAIEGEQVE